jgi:hypothetical protein
MLCVYAYIQYPIPDGTFSLSILYVANAIYYMLYAICYMLYINPPPMPYITIVYTHTHTHIHTHTHTHTHTYTHIHTHTHTHTQYALKSLEHPSTECEKGSSRYGAVTIANSTNATQLNYNILVNGSATHGVGVYINLVHEAFLQVLSTPTASITARNYPLPQTYAEKNESATASAFVSALFLLIAFCFIPAQIVVFVVKEREVKSKHQQVISGVSIYAYWISTYLWDCLSYLPTAGLVILVLYVFQVKAFVTGRCHMSCHRIR